MKCKIAVYHDVSPIVTDINEMSSFINWDNSVCTTSLRESTLTNALNLGLLSL